MKPITDLYDRFIAALCLWREARGTAATGLDPMNGVLWVIYNRTLDKRWPDTISRVVTERLQFSSFNLGDPNATLFPLAADKSWIAALSVVAGPAAVDPTLGANSYHSFDDVRLFPKWALPEKLTVKIGPFRFYKL